MPMTPVIVPGNKPFYLCFKLIALKGIQRKIFPQQSIFLFIHCISPNKVNLYKETITTVSGGLYIGVPLTLILSEPNVISLCHKY